MNVTPSLSTPATGATESALAVFAQADLWSSLQSIAWRRRVGGLGMLFVYHTAATAPDAERLRRFCSRQWPELKVVVPGEAGTDAPESVVGRLRDWRAFRPDVGHWFLDGTGARPTMLAALSRAGEEFPDWQMFARAGAGGWQLWRAATGGRLLAEPAPDAPTACEADPLDLALLLPALCPGEAVEPLWRESRAPETLTPDELTRIIAAGKTANWDWRAMFETALGRPCPAGDWSFEDFLASTLVLLGAGNTRIHLPLRLAGGRRPCEQIVDVVTVHRGCLWFIDCQRRLEPDPPVVFDNRIWLAGGARRLLIRPGRWATLTERMLSDATATLLDADDCRRIFARLCELLGLDEPQALRTIERESLTAAVDRLPVFSPATPAQQFSDAIHLDTCVFDLQRGARADAGGTPPPWLAARVAPDLWFLGGTLPRPVPAEELRRRLDDRLAGSRLDLAVIFFELTANRLSWRALVRLKGDGAPLGKWLHRWRNVPLVI